jgi:large subunit ribosomal protein L2
MALKSYKPTTPGQRGLVLIDRSELWKGRPVKALTEGLTKSGGRNNTGRITMRRVGGGAKRLYRIVDFKRRKFDVPATVERIEYDPNRTAFIALIRYGDGEQSYILAPQRLAVGDKVVAGAKVDVKPGNAMPFSGMPLGTIVHNVELKPGKGGQIARAAGTYAQFIGRDGGYAQIRLSSGELRMVRQECMATIGAVSNPDNSNHEPGQGGAQPQPRQAAERARRRHEPDRSPAWRRRGPHLGRPDPVTPWGKDTKGRRTRSNKATDKFIVRSRHAREEGSLIHGTFSLEGPLRRRLCPEEGREGARIGAQRSHQDLVAPLDHPAAIRRA